MNKFAIAFRKARLNSDKTFRQIKENVGLSIGYLSDIENGKRNPPETSLVEKIEKFLGVNDGHLVALAKMERVTNPVAISNLMKSRPELQEVLFRLEQLPEEKLNLIVEELRKQVEKESDPWFYRSLSSLIFLDEERFLTI